jgi:hypothetical protein
MRRLGPVVIAMLLLTAVGCGGGPYRTVHTGRDEGYLRFVGGRPGQIVYVDGVPRGSAEEFSGKPGVLAAPPGLRTIEVREGDQVIMRDQVFIGSGSTKTVDLP